MEIRQWKELFPFPSNCLEQASLQGVSATAGPRSQNNNPLVCHSHSHAFATRFLAGFRPLSWIPLCLCVWPISRIPWRCVKRVQSVSVVLEAGRYGGNSVFKQGNMWLLGYIHAEITRSNSLQRAGGFHLHARRPSRTPS